jgi:hypothetical protein
MIQLLKSLFGGKPRDKRALRSPTGAAREPVRAGVDYRAVSLAPNAACAAAVREAVGRRFLLRDAPRLPLPGCTKSAHCTCRYRKHADRRDGDRRLFGTMESERWFMGEERRQGGPRRLAGA